MLLLLSLTAGCGSPPETPEAIPAPRHAVLVVFDTLRADHMSIYGYGRPTTPFLEQAAGEMVRFDGVKATAPWTLPSHASIFTGLWPAEHRVHWGNKWLDDGFDTLAESLQSAGFCTFGLSANPIVSEKTGLAQGFDWYRKIPKPPETQTERLLARVPELLDRAVESDCRLFLFINLMTTHTPFDSERFGPQFGIDGPGPITGPGEKWAITAGARPFPESERKLHTASYDAAVRSVDATAERLVGMLRERGLLEESLLVLTSDHGEGLGGHAELGHVISMWEEQLAVPLLVRFPNRRRGGTVVEGNSSLTSLAPTLLDWLDVPRPRPMLAVPSLDDTQTASADYRSYFDPAFAANQPMKKRYPALAERVRHTHVTYCPPYKLLVRADKTAELYDLANDPSELTDLSAAEPEALRSCMSAYRELARDGRFTPFELDLTSQGTDTLDEETLRSLGYLQ